MEIWQAIVLGLTQGLTEFLPVSSSGHLVFLQKIFGIDGGLFVPIMLHLGTLVAVCVVFRNEIIALFKKPFKTLGFLVLASIPAAVVGLLLDDKIEKVFYESSFAGIILAVLFCVTAVVLFATEKFVKRRQNELPLNMRTVLPMAFAQAAAILPGISRSGSTISAGTLAGGKSDDIASFSFLMSIPVILGSFIVSLAKGLYNGEIQQTFQSGGATFGWCVAFGFIISALSGLFAIKVMLNAIKKANYKWFSLYLVILAAVCVILHCVGCFH
ncbi:MAG: undecaprenyl-diphosphate phosphatase [Clostridia bacterium]|nr:undecaprenyl-diphosphate phosphatase [Clostridia bacterium]